MRFLEFSRLLICVSLIALAPHVEGAEPGRENPTLDLSAVQIGGPKLPPLYCLSTLPGSAGSAKPSYVSLAVSSEGVGTSIKIPYAPPVTIFTGAGDQSGTSEMTPFLEVPSAKAGDRLLLVFHLDYKGNPTHTVLDHSPRAHPPGNIRYVNLSNEPIRFAVGGGPLDVGPGNEVTTAPVKLDNGRFVFSQIDGSLNSHAVRETSFHLRLRSPTQRLLIICATIPVPMENEDRLAGASSRAIFQPATFRLYDKVPVTP